MQKIKDSILLGVISGLLGAVPGRLLNKAEFALGFTDSRYEEMAAIPFVKKKEINKPIGKNIGKIANGLLTSVVGVSTTYVLKRTGRDHAILKGMGIAGLSWLGLYSLSTQTHIRKSKKPLTALLSFGDHLIFGATTGTLAARLGDDSLFPSKNNNQQNKFLDLAECQFTAQVITPPPVTEKSQHYAGRLN